MKQVRNEVRMKQEQKENWKMDTCVEIKQQSESKQQGKEETKRKLEYTLRQYKNENTMYSNLENATKAVFRGKFIPVNVYIKKKEQFTP